MTGIRRIGRRYGKDGAKHRQTALASPPVIARMFADRGSSAVAVTDAAETLLDIVTESDLIRRLADEDERPCGWLARLFDNSGAQTERYALSHGGNAGEVMSRP